MTKHIATTLLLLLTLCIGETTQPPLARADETRAETRVARFRIPGMVTPSCPVLVRSAVRRIAGVTRVDASLETRSAEVEYIAGRTSPEAIGKVIKDKVGLDAELVQ